MSLARMLQVEPKFLSITNYHVIAASDDVVYVWQFRTSYSKVGMHPCADAPCAVHWSTACAGRTMPARFFHARWRTCGRPSMRPGNPVALRLLEDSPHL
eukprot:356375-Chlamydomonas_euryale.AAC.17